MKANKFIIFLLFCAFACPLFSHARPYNKILNLPYADLRAWHLGFAVGIHTQNLLFAHLGQPIGPNGEEWYFEQPSYSPGFCVSGLASLRLSAWFSLRLSPGLYFGNRHLEMLDATTGATESQNLKSAILAFPFDLQYHAKRLSNFRPYMAVGCMPAIDLTKRTGELLQLKPADVYLSVSFGADFYLKYFKLIPEVKFCFGLCDVVQRDRKDLDGDPCALQFTQSLKRASSRMIVLTFYFE